MTIEELFRGAIEDELIDLQALIMFLVFEKKVLHMTDDTSELELYYQEKHRKRMNSEISAYKIKMKMDYGLYAFEINNGEYYISAYNESQAVYIAQTHYIDVKTIKSFDENTSMEFNGTIITLKSMMDKPKLLGGN